MSNTELIDKLSSQLREPFDPEAELYSVVVKRLLSKEGLMIPYDKFIPILGLDDLTKLSIRGDLLKIPLSEEDNPNLTIVHHKSRTWANLTIEKKSTNREIAEIVENLEITPHEARECYCQELKNSFKNNFMKKLSEKKFDFVQERLKLWDINITKHFEFYIVPYEHLNPQELEIYNVFKMKFIVDNFFADINNYELLNPSMDYLEKVLRLKNNLQNSNHWLLK